MAGRRLSAPVPTRACASRDGAVVLAARRLQQRRHAGERDQQGAQRQRHGPHLSTCLQEPEGHRPQCRPESRGPDAGVEGGRQILEVENGRTGRGRCPGACATTHPCTGERQRALVAITHRQRSAAAGLCRWPGRASTVRGERVPRCRPGRRRRCGVRTARSGRAGRARKAPQGHPVRRPCWRRTSRRRTLGAQRSLSSTRWRRPPSGRRRSSSRGTTDVGSWWRPRARRCRTAPYDCSIGLP